MSDQQTSSNTFTEDGRLLQAEYAIKSVSKAGTIVGLACKDGVILIGINPTESTSIEKIYKLNNTIHCVVSGIFSDALRLIKFARLASANIHEIIDQDPSISVLCDAIAEEKQKYTQKAGSRPFGVSFLYCGYEDDSYALYSTDPSGTVNRWKAWSFGCDEDAINSGLRNELPEAPMSLDDSVVALLRIIGKARENPPNVSKKMEVLLYKKDHAKILKAEEIEQILHKVELENTGK